jgi:radical SAM/Cys-rich protein
MEVSSPSTDLNRRIPPFTWTLSQNQLRLTRLNTTTLQVNMGLLCNQTCRHCHLEAGPHRSELMTAETVYEVAAFVQRGHFQIVDITGGAPELNPHLPLFIEEIASFVPGIMLRSNLTALSNQDRDSLKPLLRAHRVVIMASLPSLSSTQTDAQRGQGIFLKSIQALQSLNALGYGRKESGLKLNLVVNPTGTELPYSQEKTENEFRTRLKTDWGVSFNHLFILANVPLGRFLQELVRSDSLNAYRRELAQAFNKAALAGVMCRTTLSVSWDGYLFDCDFNLARGLFMGDRKTHISELSAPPVPGQSIAVSDHCYACTAGAGFT